MAASKRAPSAGPGDVLRIPYDGQRAVYGRVLQCDSGRGPKARGLYLIVHDRDAAPGDDPSQAAQAPRLLGPLFCTPELLREGAWPVVGQVELHEAERQLPYFLDARGLIDYGRERLPDTPENRARVVDEYVVTPELVVSVVRAARGLEQWYPGYDRFRAR